MASKEKCPHLHLIYQRGFVDVIVNYGNSKQRYDGYFKNDSNKSPHDYCNDLANTIESQIGTSITWDMEELTKRNRNNAVAFNNTLARSYDFIFSEDSNPMATASDYESKLNEKMDGLAERLKAFPNDEKLYNRSMDIHNEAIALYESCEHRLKALYEHSTDDSDKSKIAKEINDSRNKIESYKTKRNELLRAHVANTSTIYKAGESMANTGKAMQNAGNSMQSAGHAMTIGCTIPIIVVVLLFILFMILL